MIAPMEQKLCMPKRPNAIWVLAGQLRARAPGANGVYHAPLTGGILEY